MLKKILSVLMAVVLTMGVLAVAVSAEDVTEPAEPAYVSVEHQIEAIAQAIEEGHDYYLNPTDTIVLSLASPAAPTEDPETTEEPADPEPTQEQPIAGDVLIVEYFPGEDAVSPAGKTKMSDLEKSGYAVKAIGEYTDYGYQDGVRETNCVIDFQNNNGYAFRQWKVTSVYVGSNFSKITVEAEWDAPALSGWAGFQTMMRSYVKMYIDYLIEYLTGLFDRISNFLI